MLQRRMRLIKLAQRHLNEAKGWNSMLNKDEDSLSVWRWVNAKVRAHLDMAAYWKMAAESLHYVPGTWSTKF